MILKGQSSTTFMLVSAHVWDMSNHQHKQKTPREVPEECCRWP